MTYLRAYDYKGGLAASLTEGSPRRPPRSPLLISTLIVCMEFFSDKGVTTLLNLA